MNNETKEGGFLKVKLLSTGSTGNCIFVEIGGVKFLIDCGLSFKSIKETLASFGEDIDNIEYMFITHGHKDHTSSLQTFATKTKMKIFIHPNAYFTNERLMSGIKTNRLTWLSKNFYLNNDLKVSILETLHDDNGNLAFRFDSRIDKNFGVILDTGCISGTLLAFMEGLSVAVIESNYDDNIIHSKDMSFVLKRRIRSKLGHCSNSMVSKMLFNQKTKDINTIILAHLSMENNNMEHIENNIISRFPDKTFHISLANQLLEVDV